MIITKPGYYTSKAGKCEVVAIYRNHAIGWSNDAGAVWYCDTGEFINRDIIQSSRRDITGPFIDPPKPIEGWVIETDGCVSGLYFSKESAIRQREFHPGARLVHLIEDSKG